MYSADFKEPLCISKKNLKKAKPENVKRLARWLGLHIDGMSDRQIVKLVWWRITRHHKRRVEDLW